jgi:Fe(3+) dicitrate transport protein
LCYDHFVNANRLQLPILSWAVASLLAAQSAPVPVRGVVKDTSQSAIAGAQVKSIAGRDGREVTALSDAQGNFELSLAPGAYRILTSANGFSAGEQSITVAANPLQVDITLAIAPLAETLRVSGGRVLSSGADLQRLPGSAETLTAEVLRESNVMTTEEALRKVTGVHARGEDAFGLRPNIGIRGLSPTRSTKVLLLEDGLPLSYAPYGDNASYYHPPVDRFETIEVIKGGEQILFGPMTVGGVVNYVTPPIPAKRGGSVMLMGGNRDYLNGHARYGANFKNTGWMVDLLRKQGEGLRDNVRHGVTDFNVKTLTSLSSRQTIGLRFNSYAEDSNITYSGLTEREFLADPRGNPFRNDFFNVKRYAGAITHTLALSDNLVLTTNGYASAFLRDWWRQSSNSVQRPNDAADPACGGMANLLTTCGNEGRLRYYHTWGVDPKLKATFKLGSAQNELDLGFRYHSEIQERYQKNGPLPTSRDGVTVENNDRRAQAASFFLQNRFVFGNLAITPGIRFESVNFRRVNYLNNARGETRLNQWIPGIGAAYTVGNRVTFFSGLHRGFAPPRVEDIINNNTGASVDLDAELSWNYEAGARVNLIGDLRAEATFFRMAFENQIVPASVAGGLGATLTNAGSTLHQGAEFSTAWQLNRFLPRQHNVTLRTAWTALPIARYTSDRFSTVPGFTTVRITGNRLPYAPKNLLTSSLSYTHAKGVNIFFENVYTGRQFGDDLNTVGGTPDGQRGLLPGNAIWNASVNVPVNTRTTLFFTMKNLTDRLTIVDRSRGLLPGIPRLVQFGFRFNF